MTDFTRLSVTGATRRADLVVPSTEPLGALLPSLLNLLGESGGTVARPVTLVGVDGEQLDIASSAAQLDLADGSALWLVRLDQAPPPPVVIDIIDVAADAHDARVDAWSARARLQTGIVGTAAAAALAGFIALSFQTFGVWQLAVTTVVLSVLAAALGLMRQHRTGDLLTAAAAGLAPPMLLAAQHFASNAGRGDAALLIGIAAAQVLFFAVITVASGLGGRRHSALVGGSTGALISGLLLALLVSGVGITSAAAITATVAAFAIGLLPWFALSAAGLTGLDQRIADGEKIARAHALRSADTAYATLGWSVGALAAVLVVTGYVLSVAGGVWSGLLAAAIAVSVALRTRAFPLRAQVWMLWVAASAPAVGGLTSTLVGDYSLYGIAACVTVIVLVWIGVLAHPRPHVRAQIRRLGNAVETLAMVALLPLVLGSMGIYDELLAMFGGA